jgi:Domain of unknown function (DUF4272)
MTEQEKRKEKSEKLITYLGADFHPWLPLINSEKETTIRTPSEIGARIICLACVASAADEVDKRHIVSWLMQESLYSRLSFVEREFIEREGLTESEILKYSWQSECIWLLLWAVNKVERSLPTEQCSIPEIIDIIPNPDAPTSEFINSNELRTKGEILDMSDFLYRAHWATRQNEIDGKTKIGELKPDVVVEWHYAVNWLTHYLDIEKWDDITTDT